MRSHDKIQDWRASDWPTDWRVFWSHFVWSLVAQQIKYDWDVTDNAIDF